MKLYNYTIEKNIIEKENFNKVINAIFASIPCNTGVKLKNNLDETVLVSRIDEEPEIWIEKSASIFELAEKTQPIQINTFKAIEQDNIKDENKPSIDIEGLNKLKAEADKFLVPKYPRWTEPTIDLSIIIPTYNMDSMICDSIDSILNSDTGRIKYEIIVCDGESTDNTEKLLKDKYGKKIRYYNNGFGNTSINLNYGMKYAKGKYISWLSADDLYTSEYIKEAVTFLNKNKKVDYVHTDFEIWFKDSKSQYHRPVKTFIFNKDKKEFEGNKNLCAINGSTLMFRKELLYKTGLFNYSYKYRQDWDMWFRFIKHGTGHLINKLLCIKKETSKALGEDLIKLESSYRDLFYYEKDRIYDYLRIIDGSVRPRICAMLCVKNEEELLEQCLDDLIEYVDEIVVFNDGSTDDTLKILKQYPKVTNIYNQENKGNIRTEGKDRQKLLDMAQETGCEWHLFIDADEVFENSIKWRIFDLIVNDEKNLYYFPQINFWRNLKDVRQDEMWAKGRFGRLYRNFKHLKIQSKETEHCGGIPQNIPDSNHNEINYNNFGFVPMFYDENYKGKHATLIEIGVKNYGFADWNRNVNKYMERMERDYYRLDKRKNVMVGGYIWYDRMIDETGLELKKYDVDLCHNYLFRGKKY